MIEPLTESSCKKRIPWIDCAKGFAILLVIIGHTVEEGSRGIILRGIIFSFHMPLFFILSVLTMHTSKTMDEFKTRTKRSACQLLIPALLISLARIVWTAVDNSVSLIDVAYWKKQFFSMIIGAGAGEFKFYNIKIPNLGMPWFFLALFVGKTIFDFIQMHYADGKLMIICWIMSGIGLTIGQNGYIIWSADIALTIMPMFYLGNRLKLYDFSRNPIKRLLFFSILWLLTLWITFPDYNARTYLSLAARSYTLYPLCFLCASAGCMVVFYCCLLMEKWGGVIIVPLQYLGKNSLIMFAIHALDGHWKFLWNVPNRQFVTSAKRVVADLIIFTAIMIVKEGIAFLLRKKRSVQSAARN